MQKRNILFLAGFLVCSSLSAGENIDDFQSGMKLYNETKYAEAENTFKELAGRGDKYGKHAVDVYLQYAAYSAAKQKKDAEVTALIGKIDDKKFATFVKIMILKEQKKWDEILTLVKNENIEGWPDALIYDAFVCRADAYLAKKDTANAEKDLCCALKGTVDIGEKNETYMKLAILYKDVLKDNPKAIDAYGEILKLNKGRLSVYVRAVIPRAKLLMAAGKADEALKDLNSADAKEMKKQTSAGAQILMCTGEIYEGQGKKAEALAKYKEVLALDKLPEAIVDAARKKIETLK